MTSQIQEITDIEILDLIKEHEQDLKERIGILEKKREDFKNCRTGRIRKFWDLECEKKEQLQVIKKAEKKLSEIEYQMKLCKTAMATFSKEIQDTNSKLRNCRMELAAHVDFTKPEEILDDDIQIIEKEKIVVKIEDEEEEKKLPPPPRKSKCARMRVAQPAIIIKEEKKEKEEDEVDSFIQQGTGIDISDSEPDYGFNDIKKGINAFFDLNNAMNDTIRSNKTLAKALDLDDDEEMEPFSYTSIYANKKP